ncbi:hypothetical protein XENOCAPTIV_019477, partial [Xenoophorus captivus]
AAQKLSLSRRKKSQLGPSSPPAEAPGPPLLYTGGFSGALQLSPPAIPPCLLRAGSKVKDTPGMGKVRVMVRICSAHSNESSESMSFLKNSQLNTISALAPPPPGKTYTMIGRDCSTQSLGVAPTAISWLFKVIEERREKSGARFSVRVSAVEISGREETLTDLLAELSSSAGSQQEAPGAAVSLREDPVCGSQVHRNTMSASTFYKHIPPM